MKKQTALGCLTAVLLAGPGVHGQQSKDRFKQWDKNNDGRLSQDELPEQMRARIAAFDTDRDNAITRAEFEPFLKSRSRPSDRARDLPDRSSAPTHADVSYGAHEKQAFDIWLAESKDGQPTPLVIYIHGGGFRGGDKRGISGKVESYLNRGISFASLNYRLSKVGPYPLMMNDCARALQLIRSKAAEWNLDPVRVACYGNSAGAGISLWLGFHDDLADPKSDDPVARQSTRLVAAGSQNGQATYDMRTFKEWFGVPDLAPHDALVTLYGVKTPQDWESERVKKLMTDASVINHLTKDDPPVFMSYNKGDVPVDADSSPNVWVHHVRLGQKLKEAMDALQLECHVTWPEHPDQQYKDVHAFLQAKVLGTPVKAARQE